MPMFVLHELAHAYHFRVLEGGFENEKIRHAWERARAAKTYERVERRLGRAWKPFSNQPTEYRTHRSILRRPRRLTSERMISIRSIGNSSGSMIRNGTAAG